MFLQNKYHKIYYKLINKAFQEKRHKNDRYYELHHIIPKSLGGNNDAENLVLLTAKEHILAHHLLCKFTTEENQKSCLRAFHSMCFQNNGGKNQRNPSLKQLALAREYASIANKGKRGIKGPPSWSNCSTLDDWIQKLTELVASGKSDPEIGSIYQVSATSINNWKKKLQIQNRRPEIKSKQWLYDQYVIYKKSAADIAKEVGCTGTAIQQKLKLYGIPIRSSHERQQNRKIKHSFQT